jgi:hypothetical protein
MRNAFSVFKTPIALRINFAILIDLCAKINVCRTLNVLTHGLHDVAIQRINNWLGQNGKCEPCVLDSDCEQFENLYFCTTIRVRNNDKDTLA